jgi:signal transduction histidine kinase
MYPLNSKNIARIKFSILQKLIIFASIIIAGNAIVGYAVYKNNQKLHDSEKWVEHTQMVISQSENILSLAKDLEIASRSFVITADSEYLKPYRQSGTIIARVRQLRYLTRDNPTQQNRVDSLNFFVHKYLAFSTQTVDMRSKQGLSPAIARISNKQGTRFTQHIGWIIKTIQQDETSLLKKRKQTNERSIAAFNSLTIVMFILMAAFTFLLLVVTANYLRQNREKEKQAAELMTATKERDVQLVENEKQEVANKELEAFSYSVSHDLRAPLRHISGFVDLLIKNNAFQLDKTGLRYLNIISESSVEMGNLIDALLTFSRLSRNELQRTDIISMNMVAQVIRSFSDEMQGKTIEINISELPDVKGDASLINQVWVNLISNALKYSRNKEKAVIDIEGQRGSEETIFSVRDNGAGFDMKYVDKLFGVFQRLHKTRDFEGIGIGLANVNRIIVRHGGTCRAEGTVGKGATFFFSLPNN